MIAKTTTAPAGAVLLGCLVLAAALAAPVDAQAAITLEVSPLANLTYQLDCVTDVPMACGGREAFRALWRERFHEAGDEARLARWRALRGKHQGAIGAGLDTRAFFDLAERIRRAGFAARSVDEYERSLALLTNAVDARELAAIVEGVAPRFDPWWRDEAKPALERQVRALSDALATADIAAEIAFIASFYGAARNAPALVVYAIHRPAIESGNTTAQQLGEVAVAEIPANDSIEQRLPVLAHEYAHLLFWRLPEPELAALRAAVVKAGRGKGRAAWNVLDEALATALGNGRVARRLVASDRWYRHLNAERSLYSEPLVDSAAKAVLPIVDDAFDQRRSIADPGFADRYATLVIGRLGPGLAAPDGVFARARVAAPCAAAATQTRLRRCPRRRWPATGFPRRNRSRSRP